MASAPWSPSVRVFASASSGDRLPFPSLDFGSDVDPLTHFLLLVRVDAHPRIALRASAGQAKYLCLVASLNHPLLDHLAVKGPQVVQDLEQVFTCLVEQGSQESNVDDDNCSGWLPLTMSAWVGKLTLNTNDFVGIQRLVNDEPACFALAGHCGGHRSFWRVPPTVNTNTNHYHWCSACRFTGPARYIGAHQCGLGTSVARGPCTRPASETTSPPGSDNPVRQSTGELGGVCHGGHAPCAIESGFPVGLAHIFQSHGRA